MKFLQTIIFTISFLTLFSCQKSGPKDIALHKDQCANCRMTIENLPFATQIVTEKGRIYNFDDIMCMTMFENSEPDLVAKSKKYVIDFGTKKFIELNKATLIKGGSIKSPMGGNTQAYADKEKAKQAAKKYGATILK
jgi:copper chaperone NosL